MEIPRIGVGLPNYGPHAGPDAVVAVATAVERLRVHAASTFDRVFLPRRPEWQNVYGLPEFPVYAAIEPLTWAAAHTRRIRLGTGVLDALFHPPIVLARRLATLDQLSAGRVDAGIGQGWMPEEFI